MTASWLQAALSAGAGEALYRLESGSLRKVVRGLLALAWAVGAWLMGR